MLTVAIDAGDTTLPASGNHTIIAHLDAEGTPTLAVFENDTSATAAGEGRLTVRHTAAAPAVDVLADGEPAFTNLSNPNEASADRRKPSNWAAAKKPARWTKRLGLSWRS